jgi:hypothetical protein
MAFVINGIKKCFDDKICFFVNVQKKLILLPQNNEKRYIQMALELSREDTVEREFGNLMSIIRSLPKGCCNRLKKTDHLSWDILRHTFILRQEFMRSGIL